MTHIIECKCSKILGNIGTWLIEMEKLAYSINPLEPGLEGRKSKWNAEESFGDIRQVLGTEVQDMIFKLMKQ